MKQLFGYLMFLALLFSNGIFSEFKVIGQESKANVVRLAEQVAGLEAGGGLETGRGSRKRRMRLRKPQLRASRIWG